jgi:hypothetical protein
MQVTEPAKHRAARSVIEGFVLPVEDAREVEREAYILDFLGKSKAVRGDTDHNVLPEEYDPHALELKHQRAMMTRIQAWWRGYSCRLRIHRTREVRACWAWVCSPLHDSLAITLWSPSSSSSGSHAGPMHLSRHTL